MENRLKLSECRNESLESEKEHLKEELERVSDDMRKMKINSVFAEEKKEGYESTLKNEIKYLISKLLKAKQKLVNQAGSNQGNNASYLNISSSQSNGNNFSMSKNYNFSPLNESQQYHKRTVSSLPVYNKEELDNSESNFPIWKEIREEYREVGNKQVYGRSDGKDRSRTPIRGRESEFEYYGNSRNGKLEEQEFRYKTEKKYSHVDSGYDEEESNSRNHGTSGKIKNYRDILSSKIKMKNY